MILNGLIRITTPYAPSPLNETEAYIMPGTLSSSLIIAADTEATSYLSGHYTEFPSNENTILVQLPLQNFSVNGAQQHVVLHDGPCH